MKEIGSQYGIMSGSRENSLYNALWAAQALLRKGWCYFYFSFIPCLVLSLFHFFFLTLKMTSSCILRHIYMAFCINWQWNISGLQRQLISEYSCLQMKTTLLGVSQGQQKWIWQEPRCNGLKYWLIYALVAHT